MIVAKYVDGWTLEQYSSGFNDSELLELYRQGIDILCYLQQKGIEHRDIQLRTILITIDPLKVYIAGFSECAETDSSQSFKKDVTDFSRVYRSVAIKALDDSTSNATEGHMRGDPEVALLVDQMLSDRPEDHLSALEINRYIHSLVGEHMPWQFNWFPITKSWILKICYNNNEMFVEVPILLDRLLARRREILVLPRYSPPEADAAKYLHNIETFDGVKYCTAHRALKFCRDYRLEDFKTIIKDAKKQVARSNDREIRELVAKTNLRIGYHLPTLMINFTHIAEAIGWRPSYLEDIMKPTILQEVKDEVWGGTYIDKDTCTDFLDSGSHGVRHLIPKLKAVPNAVLATQFMDIDPDKFLSLPTGRLKPNMVIVRRADCFINWSPYANHDAEFISPEEACLRCDEEALPSLKKSILALMVQDRELEWHFWGPSLLKPIGDDGDDTSVNTDSIDDGDDGPFRYRR